MIVGARQGLRISETADHEIFMHNSLRKTKKTSSEQQFCGQKSAVNESGQRRRARLVEADKKVTVWQITTRYNSGMQKSISEHTSGEATAAEDFISLKNKSNKIPNKVLTECICIVSLSYHFKQSTFVIKSIGKKQKKATDKYKPCIFLIFKYKRLIVH